jgi:molybdate transport system regulatory protein
MKDQTNQLRLNYKFWIESNNSLNIMGEGKWKLLKSIRDTGSLKAATEEMGYAYRQTWENLKNIESKLGFALIEKSRGGVKGGETVLTEKGKKIVEFFDKLYDEMDAEIRLKFESMLEELNEIVD